MSIHRFTVCKAAVVSLVVSILIGCGASREGRESVEVSEEEFEALLAFLDRAGEPYLHESQEGFESFGVMEAAFTDEQIEVLLEIVRQQEFLVTKGQVDVLWVECTSSYLAAIALWANSEKSRDRYCSLLDSGDSEVSVRIARSLLEKKTWSLCRDALSPKGVDCPSEGLQAKARRVLEAAK